MSTSIKHEHTWCMTMRDKNCQGKNDQGKTGQGKITKVKVGRVKFPG